MKPMIWAFGDPLSRVSWVMAGSWMPPSGYIFITVMLSRLCDLMHSDKGKRNTQEAEMRK